MESFHFIPSFFVSKRGVEWGRVESSWDIPGTKMKTLKAIDNFRLHSNSCNNICPDGDREFTCDATQPRSDRNCIDPNKKCDRRNDCDNAKDELDCIFMADIQIRDPRTVHLELSALSDVFLVFSNL